MMQRSHNNKQEGNDTAQSRAGAGSETRPKTNGYYLLC